MFLNCWETCLYDADVCRKTSGCKLNANDNWPVISRGTNGKLHQLKIATLAFFSLATTIFCSFYLYPRNKNNSTTFFFLLTCRILIKVVKDNLGLKMYIYIYSIFNIYNE